jgi:quinol monooxygenase YgiN
VIIVSGKLTVDPTARDQYLRDSEAVTRAARGAPGCLDFQQSADLIEPDRINVYEAWESEEDAEAFRGSGPSEDQSSTIIDASVYQHEIARSTPL